MEQWHLAGTRLAVCEQLLYRNKLRIRQVSCIWWRRSYAITSHQSPNQRIGKQLVNDCLLPAPIQHLHDSTQSTSVQFKKWTQELRAFTQLGIACSRFQLLQ